MSCKTRRNRAFPLIGAILIGFMALTLLIPIQTAYGAETVPYGWNLHEEEGYGLYITDNPEVNSRELALIINYGNEEIHFNQYYEEENILSIIVESKSSKFISMSFIDGGNYRISLIEQGLEIFSLEKSRLIPSIDPSDPTPETPIPDEKPSWNEDEWTITPPGPNPWDPSPQEPQEPLLYSQSALDKIIASITVETLVVTALLMAVSMVLGAIVQRTVKFIWPTDFITLSVIVLIALQIIRYPPELVIPGIDPLWWIPVLIGYFIGFIIIGRTKYVLVRKLNNDKSFETVPWVVYHIDGVPYLQAQSNKELMKRLFFGIHHKLLSPVALEPDYQDKTKYPGWPEFKKEMVCVESWRTYEIKPPENRRFYLKRYGTEVVLAYGSMVSKYDLHRDAKAMDKVNQNLMEAENTIYMLHQSMSVRMADTVAAFMAKVYTKAPGAIMRDAVERWNRNDSKEEEAEE